MRLNLVKQHGALDRFGAVSGIGLGSWPMKLGEFFANLVSAFEGVRRLEMIPDDIGCQYFQVSKEGIGVSLIEVSQALEVVSAEPKINFLNQVVDCLNRAIAELSGNTQDHGRD